MGHGEVGQRIDQQKVQLGYVNKNGAVFNPYKDAIEPEGLGPLDWVLDAVTLKAVLTGAAKLVSIHKRRFFSAMSLNWHCWLG